MPTAAPAFTYEVRRDDQAPVAALPGARVTLKEQVEYLLRFEDPPSGATGSASSTLAASF